MKNINYLFFFLIILYSCNDSTDNSDYTVLKGGTVFIGNGNSISNGIIIIKDGKIENIGNNKTSIPDKSNIIDVTGKFITPGLIDAHVHFFQTGFDGFVVGFLMNPAFLLHNFFVELSLF